VAQVQDERLLTLIWGDEAVDEICEHANCGDESDDLQQSPAGKENPSDPHVAGIVDTPGLLLEALEDGRDSDGVEVGSRCVVDRQADVSINLSFNTVCEMYE